MGCFLILELADCQSRVHTFPATLKAESRALGPTGTGQAWAPGSGCSHSSDAGHWLIHTSLILESKCTVCEKKTAELILDWQAAPAAAL